MRLELRQVSKRFGDSQALRGVTLPIADFHSLAVIGPSGGGKTTLLRILAGLTAPDGGSISIDGQTLEFSEAALLKHRRSIGTVFQAYNLFPHLTARENVLLPLVRVHGVAQPEAEAIVAALFERFQLSRHAHQKPAELSGGQQQRVAIARTLAASPHIILFDEPTSALDPIATASIEELITELREKVTILIVTHNMQQAARISDYTAYMYIGEMVEFGVTDQIFIKPQRKETEDYITGRFG